MRTASQVRGARADGMLLTSCVLLCLVTGALHLKISELEVPNAVQAGETADLSCSYALDAGETENGLYVKWWWTSNDGTSETRRQLYQRFTGHPPQTIKQTFNITTQNGDNIILSDLGPEHSGTYECEVSTLTNEQRRNKSMVIYTEGSGPKLSVTKLEREHAEDEDVNDEEPLLSVECEASGVAPSPNLEVSINGRLLSLNETETITGPVDGVYNVSFKLLTPAKADDDSEIRCEMFYEDHSISHPVYVDTFTYKASGGRAVEPPLEPELASGPTHSDPTPPDQGDSSCRHDNSLVLLSILVVFTLGNKWLSWLP